MNNKSKVSYHLSKTEFWMLIILAAVVLVALSVIYLITPAMDALALTKQEYEMASARLEILRQDNARLQEYLAQEAEANTQLENLNQRMPAYYSQEITLGTFDTLAGKNMLDIVSVSFNGVKTDTRETFLAQLKHETQAAAAPVTEESGAVDVSTMIRYETIDLSFSGTYAGLYGFVGDLANEVRAIFVRELVVTRADKGTINGSLSLLVISGAAAEGDEYPGYEYDAPAATGKQDPFAAFPGYIEGETAELAAEELALNPDFYIILNTYDDNAQKVMMGRYLQASSEIASQSNKQLSASIVVEEIEGKVSYTYELDGKKYTGTLTPSEEHPDQLVLSVISRARKDSSDKVGVKLSVTNKTNFTFVLDVRNDDAGSPRFVLGATQGAVQVGK